MAYKKGQSGNPAGRKPGTKNKRTKLIEKGCEAGLDGIGKVVEAYVNGKSSHSLAEDLEDPSLTARDRLLIMERYAQYAYPKMQSTSVDLKAKTETVRTLEEKLSDLADESEENKDK